MTDFDQKFRFRKFPVYKDSRKFAFEVKSLARTRFPKYEQFALTSQLCRAADSIVLNIAEGADRSTDKDFAHFLNSSHTSLNEVVACLDVAFDNAYVVQTELDTCITKAAALADQLTAFRKNILSNPKK